jgi:hypothetical protein
MDKELAGSMLTWEKLGLDRNRRYYGAAWYRAQPGERGHGVFLLIDDRNAARAFRINPGDKVGAPLGAVQLKTRTPVKAYRSLAMQDPETLLAAADGAVIRFARDGSGWKETDRFSGGEDGFGKEIDIACDAGRLWVADTERHRVLCYAAPTRAPIAAFGRADQAGSALDRLDRPTTIAARGGRCVVFDSANQRLVKLALTPAR